MHRPRLVAVVGVLVAGLLAAALAVGLLISRTTAGQTVEGYVRNFGDSWRSLVSSPVFALAAGGFLLAEGLWLTRTRHSIQHVTRVVIHVAAFAYAGLLVAVTLLPFDLHGLTTRRFHLRNLVPLNGVLDWLDAVEGGVEASVAVKDVLGNVFVFIPLGVLAPLVWRRLRRLRATAATGMAVSILIELVQGVLDAGDPSVDDVLLNTLGAVIGFGLLQAGRRILAWVGEPGHEREAEGAATAGSAKRVATF